MSLIRLIVIALIIYLLLRIYKRWAANKNIHSKKEDRSIKENIMVRCSICQLHVPQNEALEKNGEFYCSQKHLDEKQD